MIKEYHKIETVFERDYATRKLIIGKFRNPIVEYLKDNIWQFTEKIDGTNIRVIWDGHRVSFAGRTDKAVIPKHLHARLEELFGGETNEQIFEQIFGGKLVILYGEGFGEKIQTNGYLGHVDFILFDVTVDDIVLKRNDVEDIANALGISVVPIVLEGTLNDGIDFVKRHNKTVINNGDFGAYMEGLVARPKVEVFDRLGERIIVKIKYRDFMEVNNV